MPPECGGYRLRGEPAEENCEASAPCAKMMARFSTCKAITPASKASKHPKMAVEAWAKAAPGFKSYAPNGHTSLGTVICDLRLLCALRNGRRGLLHGCGVPARPWGHQGEIEAQDWHAGCAPTYNVRPWLRFLGCGELRNVHLAAAAQTGLLLDQGELVRGSVVQGGVLASDHALHRMVTVLVQWSGTSTIGSCLCRVALLAGCAPHVHAGAARLGDP